MRDGRLVYELSPKYADLLPVGEESRKKKKEMLSLAYRELHSPINFLPITMQNEAEPDRGFGLIFTLMGEQSQWLTLQCCTARLNKKGDKLVSHFQYEKLEDFPDISEREKQILELATRYNRLSTLKLNKYAFTHECHNHLTILFNLLNEDSHVFIHETGYHYSLDTKPKKSELQPLHVNGAPFDMEFDVYSDQNFVYLHLVLKIEEKRIRISSESIEKHFPSVYFARDADYIYPARNMAAISALIGYLKNPVQKMVKNHTEEFLAEFVIPLMENHHVNLEKIEGYSLEHSSPKPMKKKLYVSGIGQFVMFRPTIAMKKIRK
ncbi:MAG: hypothetical protein HC819_11410 [Cyclobacteriaceae bacterium]|nr:hypothetical protein [Cyclobacteriaceae bacterium]